MKASDESSPALQLNKLEPLDVEIGKVTEFSLSFLNYSCNVGVQIYNFLLRVWRTCDLSICGSNSIIDKQLSSLIIDHLNFRMQLETSETWPYVDITNLLMISSICPFRT
jgi:hypothetical protein